MKNKKVIIAVLIGILLIGVVGISFAAYTYSRQGTTNNKQLVGDIYMHYSESNTLTLENAMPSSSYIANKYFEFTIDGKNTTTNKDIWYDITLSHGAVPNNKAETNRIEDRFLRFRLVEVINSEETEIFNNWKYSDITNKKIHVATIPRNTTSQVTHTYRLYMWIGSNVVILGGEAEGDYSISDWNNLFASVKVNASGDFTEKTVDDPNAPPTMSEMCPGCVYTYTTSMNYADPNNNGYTMTTLTSNDYKTNYQDVILSSGKNYFLGLILDNNNHISRAFSCGIHNSHPFCIEGTTYNNTNVATIYATNSDYLYRIYGEYDEGTNQGCSQHSDDYGSYVSCSGSVFADAYANGDVDSGVDDGGHCSVNSYGNLFCEEESLINPAT